jgi:hypothetical protein
MVVGRSCGFLVRFFELMGVAVPAVLMPGRLLLR